MNYHSFTYDLEKQINMFGPGSIPKHLGEIAKEEEKQFKDGIRKLVSIRDFVLNYQVIIKLF